MLRWCSYCQQFLGESPDYLKLTITHGICAVCEPRALELTGSHFKLAEFLQDVQHRLQEAGRRNDLAAAENVIETAREANIRAVDVLIGIIAPTLFQVGEDWKRNLFSVADEHRFTSFYNEMYERIASKMRTASAPTAKKPDVVLMNAPGNRHLLAMRILSLWLWNKGVRVRMIDWPLPVGELITLIVASRTRVVLISMALAEQLAGVTTIVERVAELPVSIRPRVIVGGYAVKLGLVSAIPGAELMGDISFLWL